MHPSLLIPLFDYLAMLNVLFGTACATSCDVVTSRALVRHDTCVAILSRAADTVAMALPCRFKLSLSRMSALAQR